MAQTINTITNDGVHELFSGIKLRKEDFLNVTDYYSYAAFVRVLEETKGSKKVQLSKAVHAEVYDKTTGLYAVVQDLVIVDRDIEAKYRPSILLVRAENGVYTAHRGTDLVNMMRGSANPRRVVFGYDGDATELPGLSGRNTVLHVLGNLNVEATPLDNVINSSTMNSVLIWYAVKRRDARLYRWLKWPFPANIIRAAYPDVYDRLFREPSEVERRRVIMDYYREKEGIVGMTLGEFRLEVHGAALDDGSVLSDRLELTAAHMKFGKRSISVRTGRFYIFKFTIS